MYGDYHVQAAKMWGNHILVTERSELFPRLSSLDSEALHDFDLVTEEASCAKNALQKGQKLIIL